MPTLVTVLNVPRVAAPAEGTAARQRPSGRGSARHPAPFAHGAGMTSPTSFPSLASNTRTRPSKPAV